MEASSDAFFPDWAKTWRNWRAVTCPSPVVSKAVKMVWPDCSPPTRKSWRSISSSTFRSPTAVQTKSMP